MNVDDPSSDEFYDEFRRIAKKNAEIYEEVFYTLPTNRVRNFVEIEAYTQRFKLTEKDPPTVRSISFIDILK